MTLFRGYGGDLPLMPWLEEKIWPVEARLDDEDVYWGARLACVEMIRTGTVRFWDMYWHPGRPRGRSPTPACGRRSGRRCSTQRRRRRGCARRALRGLEELAGLGPAVSPRPRPARDLHGQRGVAALDRRAQRRARAAGPDPPLRDRGGGRGLPRRTRPAARRLPRPAGLLERAHRARPRRLDRPRELELIAARGCHRRHQPGREHEARGRRRLPLPGGARGRGRGRARHRRRRLQRLARPARRPQGLRARPEARRRDPTAIAAAEAWAVATGAGRRCSARRAR